MAVVIWGNSSNAVGVCWYFLKSGREITCIVGGSDDVCLRLQGEMKMLITLFTKLKLQPALLTDYSTE